MKIRNPYGKMMYNGKNFRELSYRSVSMQTPVMPDFFFDLVAYMETEAWHDWSLVHDEGKNWFSLHYITSGRCIFQYEKTERILEPGSLVMMCPGSSLKCCRGERFRKRSLAVYYNPFRIYLTAPDSFVICQKNREYISRIFDAVKERILHPDEQQNSEISMHIYHLFYLLLKSCMQKENNGYAWIFQAVGKNPQQYSCIGDMMKEFNITKTMLRKIFREKHDTTPMEYVIRMRYEKAIWYLRNESPSIREIADICGFHSVPFFIRGFKKRYGCTPLQYRKEAFAKKVIKTGEISSGEFSTT